VKAPLNIGLTDASRRTADMPLYTLRRLSNGDLIQTTDPGRAMMTGKWADVGKFKRSDPSGARGAGAVLSQRLRVLARCRRRFLRNAIRHRNDDA
jgi:hypothetical protein